MLDFARTHPDDAKGLFEALRYNMELWTIFQADLMDDGCPLEEATRQELLDLSLFMDSATVKMLDGVNAGTLRAMIDVNRTLADR